MGMGKVVVVGAGVGLGLHLAAKLADIGAEVVLIEEPEGPPPKEVMRAPTPLIRQDVTQQKHKRKHRGKRRRNWG